MQRGNSILFMQQQLRKLSYFYPIKRVIPSGYYDKNTRDAVIDFERCFSLVPTGQIDSELYNKINQECINACNSRVQTLDVTDNEDVILLFKVLNNIIAKKYQNIKKLDINGSMDENTINNIKDIQNILSLEQNGLLSVDFLHKLITIF